ncbi:MAG: hypothetical protein Q8L26_00350 [Candidatus Omnitrophota bacterium]|nr:hypothetical protein [Candidatus Omnitrophota bacterium]
MDICNEFKNIAGFDLSPRQTNYISGYIERIDSLFYRLSILYFSSPEKLRMLQGKIKNWLKEEQIETIFSLAGYIYYIAEDFSQAKKYFLKSISRNPDNLDNWIDLAFALRHLGEYKLSNGILFNHDYVIYYYKYLKLNANNFSKLKSLVLEISEKILSNNI